MKTTNKGFKIIKKYESCASKCKGVDFKNKIYPNGKLVWSQILCSSIDIKNNVIVYPYICEAGKKTIGYGTVISHNNFDKGIDVITCTKLLTDKIVNEFEPSILNDKNITKIINQSQFDAIISLIYNIGSAAFAKSTLRKNIITNISNKEKIKEQWLKWSYVNKVKNEGLLKRRMEEYSLFIS
jgi:lysozyme